MFTVTKAAAPKATGFAPTSGPVGTTVVITGTGFTGATSVQFAGKEAQYTVNSATQITATVPTSTLTGKIRIATPTGAVQSATSFTVTEALAPTTTGFSPTSGVPGTTVVITGTGFTGATNVVFSGTREATFTVDSPTQITAIVPPSDSPYYIRIVTPAGTATTSQVFNVQRPTWFAGASTFSGVANDTIQIATALSPLRFVSSVSIGGVLATSSWMSGSVYFVIPAGAPSGYDTVILTLDDGTILTVPLPIFVT